MYKIMSRLFVLLFVCSSVFPATIKMNMTVSSSLPAYIDSASVQKEIDALEAELNKSLSIGDQGGFLKAMGNAGTIANKGIGVDYASNISLFVVGIGVGTGVNLGNYTISNLKDANFDKALPPFGMQPQATVMGGARLGFLPTIFGFDPKRIAVYGNLFTYSTKIDKVDVGMTNIGGHVQYKLIDVLNVVPFGVLRWGGVDLTSGFEYSKFSLNLTEPVDFSQTSTYAYNGQNVDMTGKFTGNGTLGVTVTTVSIPFEISTNVQLIHILSVFVGAGVDMKLGGAKTTAALTGPAYIDAKDPSNGSLTRVASGNPVIDIGESGGPSFGDIRFFIGPQLNIVALKIYAQVNYATDNSYGAHVGLRVAW